MAATHDSEPEGSCSSSAARLSTLTAEADEAVLLQPPETPSEAIAFCQGLLHYLLHGTAEHRQRLAPLSIHSENFAHQGERTP